MKIKLLIIALVITLFTACESNDKATTTTTTTKSTTSEQIVQNVLPCMFYYQDTLHIGGGFLYDGKLDEFDDSMLEGYVLIGETGTMLEEIAPHKPSKDFETNYVAEGTPIYYNEEIKTYAFYEVEDDRLLRLKTHSCDKDCKKVTD